MRRAFEHSALLVLRARWVWPRLTFSLGYPPLLPFFCSNCLLQCFRSPLIMPSGLSAALCRCTRGRATLVLAKNCSSALVALGSPKSRPCGCSSAAVGFITRQRTHMSGSSLLLNISIQASCLTGSTRRSLHK